MPYVSRPGYPGVELGARAELAARRDGEGGVSALRPLFGNRRVALVSGSGDDGGQGFVRIGRQAVPRGEANAVYAVVERLEDVHAVAGAHRLRADFGGEGDVVDLLEDVFPEIVEVLRLADFAAVGGVDDV